MDIKNYYVEKGSGIPLLLLHGNNENGGYLNTKDVIKQSHTEFIAKNIANAKLCIIDGDHCVANKSFKEFNRIAADFLNED